MKKNSSGKAKRVRIEREKRVFANERGMRVLMDGIQRIQRVGGGMRMSHGVGNGLDRGSSRRGRDGIEIIVIEGKTTADETPRDAVKMTSVVEAERYKNVL
jgi:hypothetical protein